MDQLFSWLNERTPFCHERAESLSFRLINNQILVEEFNDETFLSGELIDEVSLQLYRYHKTAQETKLLFSYETKTMKLFHRAYRFGEAGLIFH